MNVKRILLPVLAAGLGLTTFAQKAVPNGWHLTDPKTSGYYGLSLDKAYSFLKGKQSKTVVVAVIDSGVDTTHEDLKPILWTNPKEIPGNGIDDDKNGYVDDVHGWNFLGNKDGRNVGKDSYEAARVYHRYLSKFADITDPSALSKEDQDLYTMWRKAKMDVTKGADNNQVLMIKRIMNEVRRGDSLIQKDLGKAVYGAKDLQQYKPTAKEAMAFKNIIIGTSQSGPDAANVTNKDLVDEMDSEIAKAEAAETPPPTYRADVVKDNEADITDKYYGNNDVMAIGPDHGTHVSGIIAAARANGKGIDGIADNVRIMMVRAVPDGDEHDKDIALAIRYAVDNGARVINMSFGKGVSPEKTWVDDAVRYAQSKGVLLVHAAGNERSDNDTTWNFPNPVFKNDKSHAANWITVGASGAEKENLVANFSNYGKEEVDVFAPGVNIYSSVPGGNTYANFSGTSMASPVVAGLAALILEYYPQFTPQQVKAVIEQSAVPFTADVTNPETGAKVKLSELSRTGGVVNAYTAVLMADELARTGKFKTDGGKIKVDGKDVKIKKGEGAEKKKEKVKSA